MIINITISSLYSTATQADKTGKAEKLPWNLQAFTVVPNHLAPWVPHLSPRRDRGLSWNPVMLMVEILHQLIGGLSHYLQRFIHPWWRYLHKSTHEFHPRDVSKSKAKSCKDARTSPLVGHVPPRTAPWLIMSCGKSIEMFPNHVPNCVVLCVCLCMNIMSIWI